nr:hypothetical protein [uncultured bacterium]
MSLQIIKSESDGTLQLAGALDIYSADALREALLQALRESSTVTLDLGAAESCDLVAVQLLCAAQRSAAAQGKPLVFHAVSTAVTEAATALGLPEARFAITHPR